MSIWRVIEVGVVFCSIICCLVFISSPSKEISFSHYLNKLQDQFEEEVIISNESGKMINPWQTPILFDTIDIWLQSHSINTLEFNREVSSVIKQAFEDFIKETEIEQTLPFSGAHSFGKNELFYDWQVHKGWKEIEKHSSIKKLQQYFLGMSKLWLHSIGRDDLVNTIYNGMDIEIWATMHFSGISHLTHTHPNSLVSGVYYVEIPKDNYGMLLLEDPRGPLPPFDNRIKIQPKEGDIVLFPSWLPHQVTPTSIEQPRISIAFNIPGKWEDTTNLSVEYDLQ